LNFTHTDPIKALSGNAVLNGVVVAPGHGPMMLISRRSDIMGNFVIGWHVLMLGWEPTRANGRDGGRDDRTVGRITMKCRR
jgi:hypothetical protein